MSLRHLLNTTIDVETQTQSKTPTGGASVAWVSKATAVPARVMQLDADAVIAAGKLGYQVSHRVYLDTEQNLTIKERVIFDGVPYDVKRVNNAGGHLDRLWQVDVYQLPSK